MTLPPASASKFKQKLRKLITGSTSIRIRDALQTEPSYIMLLDKGTKIFDELSLTCNSYRFIAACFTANVLNLNLGQYFLISRPDLFPIYYFAVVLLCVGSRIVHFKTLGYEYFLLDFCYCLISVSCLFLLFFPSNEQLFKVIFIFANGPLPFALIVYRNSLVFHDFDKVTSVAIHLLPSMMTYAYLWNSKSVFQKDILSSFFPFSKDDYTRALTLYIAWQLMYFLKTEITDRNRLDSNPNFQTSLRFLASNSSSISRFMLYALRSTGIYGKSEEFNSSGKKTKVVFIISQLIFTCVTTIHTAFLYNSKELHVTFITLIYCYSLFYGAGYYVEIFSRRYYEGVLQKQSLKRVSKAVATFVVESANERSLEEIAAPFSPLAKDVPAQWIQLKDASESKESTNPLIGQRTRSNIVRQVSDIIDCVIDNDDEPILIYSEESSFYDIEIDL